MDYFEIFPQNVNYDYYTLSRVLGSNTDVLGGQCPIANSTGLSRCQYDYRIASNDPNATIYTGKVDPDLKPFTQTEFTAGLEREIARSMVLSVRYTRKSLDNAIEDAGFPTAEGSEAYIIGNPGAGLHAETAKPSATPRRRPPSASTTPSRRASTAASRTTSSSAWPTPTASCRATTRASRARTRTAAPRLG